MRDTDGIPIITTPEIGFYSAKDHPSPGAGDPGSGSVRSVSVPALRARRILMALRVLELGAVLSAHSLILSIVGPECPVLGNADGDTSLLKPGAAVFVIALKKPDGTVTSARLYAEKDGIKPPM